MKRFITTVVLCVAMMVSATGWGAQEPGPLQVFVLVGQSNMQGKGRLEHLDKLIADEKTAAELKHLKKGDAWTEFDEVWIKYWDAKGNLKAGYGSPGIGPELGFGRVIGAELKNQVLIIKVAWGGQSLARSFRPPSSGPSEQELRAIVDKTNEKNKQEGKPEVTLEQIKQGYGPRYRDLIKEVKTVLADIKAVFPEYDESKGYKLAGMVWFQGFNDVINTEFRAEYHAHMVNFIKDVRKDLGVADLPFVIGELGMAGVDPPKRYAFKHFEVRKAQKDAANLPEFKGTAAYVETAPIMDAWKATGDKWYDGGYHYGGSAAVYYRMGEAFGKAMLKLLPE